MEAVYKMVLCGRSVSLRLVPPKLFKKRSELTEAQFCAFLRFFAPSFTIVSQPPERERKKRRGDLARRSVGPQKPPLGERHRQSPVRPIGERRRRNPRFVGSLSKTIKDYKRKGRTIKRYKRKGKTIKDYKNVVATIRTGVITWSWQQYGQSIQVSFGTAPPESFAGKKDLRAIRPGFAGSLRTDLPES